MDKMNSRGCQVLRISLLTTFATHGGKLRVSRVEDRMQDLRQNDDVALIKIESKT